MNKRFTALTGLTLLLFGCTSAPAPSTPRASGSGLSAQATLSSTAIIDTRIRHQTFRGWGTSLAWWANVVGGWSSTSRDGIMDALYSPAGLNFTVARYNLGADAPDNVCRGQMRPGGNVQSLSTAPGVYDWARDANQRWVLKAAQARGANLLEAFVNSAPSYMLTNRCTAGATSPGYNNLRTDQYNAYGDYVATVLKRFRDVEGVKFTTVAPLNEPDSGYWFSTGKQEGMNVTRAEQPKIIGAVAAALGRQGVTTPLSAMDTTDIDLTNTEFLSYPDTTRSLIRQINSHAYKGSLRSVLRNTAQRYGKGLWMSEYGCCDVGNTPENQLSTALRLAGTIQKDLTDLQAEAWVYWQAVEHADGSAGANHTWGLIKANLVSGETFGRTKAYFGMGQFSKFIRPGAQILPISRTNTVAALNTTNQLVVVAINDAGSATPVTLDLSGFTSTGGTARLYRTSGTENLAQLASVTVSNRSLALTLAPSSITTVVIDSASAAAPSTALSSGKSYKILNKNSWKALEVYGESAADGAAVSQYNDSGSHNQRWIISDLGNGSFRLTNKNSGKALDVAGGSTAGGAGVIQYASNGGLNQQWQIQPSGQGYYKLINRGSQKALDVNAGSLNNTDPATNTARIIQWDSNDGDNQQWLIVRAD
ncbi:RICIN domain-containing protein [Deinococcus hopiensis]|uniref:O-Glycosyl hydrolase n=1 Tax=Deinococcus hopiensis KR-140 TaxID=695939 RepID=A0A1W1UNN5_9DEIO|nr:RICIN domain-containing protein [Deinococcus hopiensis]SMB82735.1 O-Glycosyl hydrolase [Deinococcus hopiensis KR-140]